MPCYGQGLTVNAESVIAGVTATNADLRVRRPPKSIEQMKAIYEIDACAKSLSGAISSSTIMVTPSLLGENSKARNRLPTAPLSVVMRARWEVIVCPTSML